MSENQLGYPDFDAYFSRISPQYVAEMRPPVIARGSGCRIFDVDGREYVDLDAGWGGLGLGHCHPELVEVTKEAVATLEHTTPPRAPMARFMDRLGLELEGSGLNKFFFGVSGSETVEHALMICSASRPGRRTVVALDRAYHGSSLGLIPLGFQRHPLLDLKAIEPLLVPTPHCYRCPFQKTKSC